MERIEETYKLDVPSKYNASATFNVADLSLFDVSDAYEDPMRVLFQEGGHDAGASNTQLSTSS